MTVLYGSNVADATLTTACDMATTTGGTETSQTSTASGNSNFQEVYSQGGTPASVSSIPGTPTGHGWLFKPGAGTFAAGNWSGSVTMACNAGTGSVVTVRVFKYDGSSTYTLISSLNTFTISGHPKTTYSISNTSLSSFTTLSTDYVYIDMWWNDTGGVSTNNPVVYQSTSATQGVANDMQITTSTFTAGGTTVNKDLKTRFRLGKALDLTTRFRLSALVNKDLSSRFRLGKALDLSTRFRLSALKNSDLASRFRLGKALDLSSRFRLGKPLDLSSRFNLQKALDLSTRMRLGKALDLTTRFNLVSLGTSATKDLSTRFRLFAPSYTNVDASYQKFQVVKVYSPDRSTFLGTISDAPYITGIKSNINAADDAIHIILPRPIDAYDGQYQPGSMGTIVMGNCVQVWVYGAGLPASGKLKFNGFIDTITPKLDENGSQSVDVLCTPYSQLALGDHGITTTINIGTSGSSSTYIDTGAMFASFFTGTYNNSSGVPTSTVDAITSKPYGDPFTMDGASVALTGQKSQFGFQNQTMLSAETNVLLLSPTNYFFRMNPILTTFFGQYPTSPIHTLLLGQHITSIEFPQDNVPRKNVVLIQGNGVQGKYVGSSVSTIGERVYFKADNRITDANTAQALANGLGALLDQTIIRAKVKIPDYRGDQQPGLGYDIEKFQVGDTVKLFDARAPASSATGAGSAWGSFVWGQGKWGGAALSTPTIWGSFNWGQAVWGTSLGTIFNTVVPIMSVNYNFHYVELELGFRAPTINRKVFDIEARLADATLLG